MVSFGALWTSNNPFWWTSLFRPLSFVIKHSLSRANHSSSCPLHVLFILLPPLNSFFKCIEEHNPGELKLQTQIGEFQRLSGSGNENNLMNMVSYLLNTLISTKYASKISDSLKTIITFVKQSSHCKVWGVLCLFLWGKGWSPINDIFLKYSFKNGKENRLWWLWFTDVPKIIRSAHQPNFTCTYATALRLLSVHLSPSRFPLVSLYPASKNWYSD